MTKRTKKTNETKQVKTRAQALDVMAHFYTQGVKAKAKVELPDPTAEHVAELGRWLVHEGSKEKDISWGGVIAYANAILHIAYTELGEKEFRRLEKEGNPTVAISQQLYQQKSYWIGDPVIQQKIGIKTAIREWLRKVQMEP